MDGTMDDPVYVVLHVCDERVYVQVIYQHEMCSPTPSQHDEDVWSRVFPPSPPLSLYGLYT